MNETSLGKDPTRQLIRGRYEPLAQLGAGGQGEVLLAMDHQHDRKVAIKVRQVGTDREREGLLREARVLLRLTPHWALPLVREDFFEGERYYLVMDWIDGRNLSKTLQQEGSPGLPYVEVCAWLSQVAEALDHLHTHTPPIVHRDVKPSNFVVTPDGRAVLVDFGLGEEEGSGPSEAGSRPYLAPEISGQKLSSPAADVFSLAVAAWELLTGEVPFPGVKPDWSSVPPVHTERVERTLIAGLSVDPSARPSSAGALIAAIVPPPPRTNLPLPLSSFVGRQFELLAVTETLATARLVTLTGVGGSGKTRLGQEVARQMFGSSPSGVWFCDFAPVADPSSLTQVVATSIGATHQPGKDLTDAITSFIGDQECLIVLDNCEHVIEDCSRLAELLLGRCSGLRLIATSRSPLRLPGEVQWEVPPLELPDAETSSELAERASSIRLFADRAREANPSFSLDPESLPHVREICVRLEGLPLAIELAAALMHTATVVEIERKLSDRFGALISGYRTAPPKQQTLKAALEWSYDLLSDKEQSFLRKTSVFAGAFNTQAARKVGGDDAPRLLERLREASLLQAQREESARYRMLETVREFAAEKLTPSEEIEARTDHLTYFLEMAQTAYEELTGPNQKEWLERVDLDLENFRFALSWTVRDPAFATDGLALGARLARYFGVRGYLEEGRTWLSRALEQNIQDKRIQGRALGSLAGFMKNLGDIDAARETYEKARAVSSEIDDKQNEAASLIGLGGIASTQGDFENARKYHEGAHDLFIEISDRQNAGAALYNLGVIGSRTGDYAEALRRYEAALEISRETGELRMISTILSASANAAMMLGDYLRASEQHNESLEIARQLGDRSRMAVTLLNLGSATRLQGDLDLASKYNEEALAVGREIGDSQIISAGLGAVGTIALQRGQYDKALSFLKESFSVAEKVGDKRSMATHLHDIGVTEGRRGNQEAARTSLERAVQIQREVGDRRSLAEGLNTLGSILWEMGDRSSALESFEEALGIARDIGYTRLVIGVLNQLGEACRVDGEVDQARSLFIEALSAAALIEDKIRIAESSLSLISVISTESPHLAAKLLGSIEGAGKDLLTDPNDKDQYGKHIEALNSSLGAPSFSPAFDEGKTNPDSVIKEALEVFESISGRTRDLQL